MSSEGSITFRWTIKNFDMCSQLKGQHIESPHFTMGSSQTVVFNLILLPRGEKVGDGRHVSLYLQRSQDRESENISLTIELCFVDSAGSLTNIQKSPEVQLQKGNKWGFHCFYLRDYILSQYRNQILPDNSLTIQCRLMPSPEIEYEKNLYNAQDAEDLSNDLAMLFNNGMYSDITIINNGERFCVHKAILECRCPKILEHLVITETPNVYYLPSVTAASDLRALLRFVYTGKIASTSVNKFVFASNMSEVYGLCNRFPLPNYIEVITDIPIRRFPFKWIIKNLSTLQTYGEPVCPVFLEEKYRGIPLRFLLNIEQYRNEYRCLRLKMQRERVSTPMLLRCKLLFGQPGITSTLIAEFEHLFKEEEYHITLNSPKAINECTNGDDLHIFVDICISNDNYITKMGETAFEMNGASANTKHLDFLQRDFRNLIRNDIFADLILCVGGAKIHAHKAILCARSRVFSNMFLEETVEKKSGIIILKDIDFSTLLFILEYVNCGYTHDLGDIVSAANLFDAAEKYKLLTLKDKCTMFVKANISTENCGEMMLLFNSHQNNSIKQCIYDFIMSNLESLSKSENFLTALAKLKEPTSSTCNPTAQFVSIEKS